MRETERLFDAIGGVDPALLRRSEKPSARRRRGLALVLAAMLCVVLGLGIMGRYGPSAAVPDSGGTELLPPEESPETQTAPPEGSQGTQPPPEDEAALPAAQPDGAVLLLLSAAGTAETADFTICINAERYDCLEADGVYTITPKIPSPEGLPACYLEIRQVQDRSPAQLAEDLLLEGAVAKVEEADRRCFRISGGDTWDAAQREVTVVDDGQGGAFVLSAHYFLEAEEGHGVRFRAMADTFQVMEEDMPLWMLRLEETVRALTGAIYADDLAGAAHLLAEGARIDSYGEDISKEVSTLAFDYAVEGEKAVASVKHHFSLEEAANFLTIELIYEDGRWLATWAGIDTRIQ